MPKTEILIFDCIVAHCPEKYRGRGGHTLPAPIAASTIGQLCRKPSAEGLNRGDRSGLPRTHFNGPALADAEDVGNRFTGYLFSFWPGCWVSSPCLSSC